MANRSRASLRLEPLPSVARPDGVHVHRKHAVNLARIQEIRRRKGREDWELKLAPPVNRLLPVSRGQVGTLLKVFGAGK